MSKEIVVHNSMAAGLDADIGLDLDARGNLQPCPANPKCARMLVCG
ncbi:MAG TPA: hypothetical protein P5214_08185 [Rectinema sp.]|nr:hypothetical protein [Rectinema sp.]